MLKKILLGVVVIIVLLQLIRPEKNIHSGIQPNALKHKYPIPENVASLLQTACYDCHSNQTKYPWYAEIQPIGWYVYDHVKDGKKHLNFDEFETYPLKRKLKKIHEISETINEGDMPLTSYTLIHKNANLSTEQKQMITSWADSLATEIH